jgi:hypothetical protein
MLLSLGIDLHIEGIRMAENAPKTSKFRFGRKTTIGVLGGVVGGALLSLALLLFVIAINAITPGTIPTPVWLMGMPLGFASGALIAIEEFGE